MTASEVTITMIPEYFDNLIGTAENGYKPMSTVPGYRLQYTGEGAGSSIDYGTITQVYNTSGVGPRNYDKDKWADNTHDDVTWRQSLGFEDDAASERVNLGWCRADDFREESYIPASLEEIRPFGCLGNLHLPCGSSLPQSPCYRQYKQNTLDGLIKFFMLPIGAEGAVNSLYADAGATDLNDLTSDEINFKLMLQESQVQLQSDITKIQTLMDVVGSVGGLLTVAAGGILYLMHTVEKNLDPSGPLGQKN